MNNLSDFTTIYCVLYLIGSHLIVFVGLDSETTDILTAISVVCLLTAGVVVLIKWGLS